MFVVFFEPLREYGSATLLLDPTEPKLYLIYVDPDTNHFLQLYNIVGYLIFYHF
jgi:hypothetical protein